MEASGAWRERLSFLSPPETPCFKCLFPVAPPSEVFPVVGATPGIIGSFQALETIKYLTGIGENLKGKILVWEGKKMEFNGIKHIGTPNALHAASLIERSIVILIILDVEF